jgi:hypothetical protein
MFNVYVNYGSSIVLPGFHIEKELTAFSQTLGDEFGEID